MVGRDVLSMVGRAIIPTVGRDVIPAWTRTTHTPREMIFSTDFGECSKTNVTPNANSEICSETNKIAIAIGTESIIGCKRDSARIPRGENRRNGRGNEIWTGSNQTGSHRTDRNHTRCNRIDRNHTRCNQNRLLLRVGVR